jgi:hypothetical protein
MAYKGGFSSLTVSAIPLSLTAFLPVALIMLGMAIGGCDSGASAATPLPPLQQAPAIITENSRDTTVTNDFLRLSFFNADPATVTTLGGPGRKRVFAASSVFVTPPLTLGETAMFAGIPDRDSVEETMDLFAMRCIAPNLKVVDPILATWTNLFSAIVADFSGAGFNCPSGPDPQNIAYCEAKAFTDAPAATAAMAIGNALMAGIALQMLPTSSTNPKLFLNTFYGISSAYSGLGFAVSGGTGLPGEQYTPSATLPNLIDPEYLLNNVTLSQANCYCIQVPPYAGRKADLMDVDFIKSMSTIGRCVPVSRLPS